MKQVSSITLSIVFLNYNRLEETRKNIEMLLEMTNGRSDIQIIAVDNNSTDGTAEYLRDQDSIQTILLPDNNGIAGYNEGFKQSKGRYILVLDDDSCPCNAETLDLLIALLNEDQSIGIVACHIESADGPPQWSWHLPKQREYAPSPFFIGCGFAIRRELFAAINWYPGEFFIYQNEIDVAFKVRQEGYTIYYHPDCRVVHRAVLSSRGGWRRIYFSTRNTLWLIRKYYPMHMAVYMIPSRILIGFGRAMYFRQLKTFFKAVKEGLTFKLHKQILSPSIRRECLPFWKQNSLLHQLFRKA